MNIARMTIVLLVAIFALLIFVTYTLLTSSKKSENTVEPSLVSTEATPNIEDTMGLHGIKSEMRTVVPESVAPEVEKIRSQVKVIDGKPCGLSPHDVRYFPSKPGAPTGEKCYQDGELARFDVVKKYAVGGRKITYYFDAGRLIWSQEKEYDNDLEMDQRVNMAASKVKYRVSYFHDSKMIYQESNSVLTKDADIYQKEAKRIQDELAVFKETI